MEASKVPGLYIIGEAVDITAGWADITSNGPGRVDGLRGQRWDGSVIKGFKHASSLFCP